MATYVRASTHQGDSRYKGFGRQCTAMAMASIAYHKVKSVAGWQPIDMDDILGRGDQIYMHSSELQNVTFLMPSEVVQSIDIDFQTVTTKTLSTHSGVFSLGEQDDLHLLTLLESVQQACILTFGQVCSSYAVAVIREGSDFYVFDSHSRSVKGLCVPDGRACVTKHASMRDVVSFITILAGSVGLMNECLFEVVEIEAFLDDQNFYHSGTDMSTEEDVPLIKLTDHPTSTTLKSPGISDEEDIPLIQLLEHQTSTPMKTIGISDEEDSDFEVPLATVQEKMKAKEHPSQLNTMCSSPVITKGTEEHPSQLGSMDSPIATENGTEERRLSRKRRKDMANWKVNIRKRKRNHGEEYETVSGVLKRKRVLKPGCGALCRNRCQSVITHDERTAIFHNYWQMGCLKQQRDYLSTVVTKQAKASTSLKASQSEPRRNWTYNYYLRIGDKQVSVCKKMFLDTLDISERIVFTALNKQTDIGMCSEERRGKHKQRGITEEKEKIRQHIDSFPRMESHYSRKDSKREYLESSLSLQKMYSLYVEAREKEGCTPASETIYREVFNTDFNISFHKRMKDRCDTCAAYENTKQDSVEYEEHVRLKKESRLFKDRVKEELKSNPSRAAAVFDLEEVLPCPSSEESCLYYKRKLSTYNLTVYDYRNGQGYCYVWSEVEGLRGSNEIASCVYRYLERLKAEGVSDVVLFSDSCGGQNRNKNFLTMLWYALRKMQFKTIEHVFFVTGHSQNEGDSIHSAIERASRHVPVYTPAQWAQVIRSAKRKKPLYTVEETNRTNMFDFKQIASSLKNFELDTDKEKVRWLKVKRFALSSQAPNMLKVYYDYSDNFKSLNLFQKIRVLHQIPDDQAIKLEHVSSKPYPLDKDKFCDLLDLCSKNIIPNAHHDFFKSLPHQ